MHIGPISRRRLLSAGLAVLASQRVLSDRSLAKTASTTPAAPSPSKPGPTIPVSSPPTVPPRGDFPRTVAARYATTVPTQWGLDVTGVVTRFVTTKPLIALTFDACGTGALGSQIDQDLISFLIANSVPATLFLNTRWINANPRMTQQLVNNPLFCIGNHGTVHLPLSVTGRSAYGLAGTTSANQVADEVWGNHETLRGLIGAPPRYFRSGTAHYDEVAVRIVQDLGERVIGFTINGDAGATFSAAQVQSTMRSPKPGSIVIAHMNHPEGATFEGFRDSITALRRKGFEFVRVSDVDSQLI